MRRVAWRRHLKEIFFDDGSSIKLLRSACVSDGDSVVRARDGAYVVCKNGSARILPTNVALEKVLVGSLELDLVVKEITEPEEFVPLIFLGVSTGLSLFGMVFVVVTMHPEDRRIGQYFYKLLPLTLFASIICLALGLIILGSGLFDLA